MFIECQSQWSSLLAGRSTRPATPNGTLSVTISKRPGGALGAFSGWNDVKDVSSLNDGVVDNTIDSSIPWYRYTSNEDFTLAVQANANQPIGLPAFFTSDALLGKGVQQSLACTYNY